MNLKRNVNFFLESRKKNGVKVVTNVPIRMRVKFKGERIEFSTGYRIDEDKWDASKQKVRNGCANKQKQTASQINAYLADCYAKIQNIFQEFEYENVVPSVEQVKKMFQQKTEKKSEKAATITVSKKTFSTSKSKNQKQSFWHIYDLFVSECGRLNDWTEATYEKFAAAKNHMNSFDENMTFESLDENRLNDYVIHLRNARNLRNSTISKQIGFLKWFLRWANHKGHNPNRIYEIFKPKLKYARKVVVFLCEKELVTLRELEIPYNKQYLERVRDVFLFCCWTGLRYSDVYNLKKHDIKGDYFEIVTIKTLDKLIIDYNVHSHAILEKYKNVMFEGGKALPVISNQKMNGYVKELCELAGFTELITLTHFKGNQRIEERAPKYSLIGTHTGRRSFICNALALGIGVETVMQWTGHNDFKSMKPYIDVANHLRAKAMTKFNDFAESVN